jgi:NAD(P)-dependent dehydrogenase (short-subunit alcohol dehydrogenase family)
VVVCTAADKKKVVVVGGTGRVGSATAASLLENFSNVYDVSVAGRSRENFDKILQLRPGLKGASYVACDITDLESVKVQAPGSLSDFEPSLHGACSSLGISLTIEAAPAPCGGPCTPRRAAGRAPLVARAAALLRPAATTTHPPTPLHRPRHARPPSPAPTWSSTRPAPSSGPPTST